MTRMIPPSISRYLQVAWKFFICSPRVFAQKNDREFDFFIGASGDIFKVFQVIRKTKATKQNEGMVLTSEPRQFKKLTMQKKTPCSLDAVQFHRPRH